MSTATAPETLTAAATQFPVPFSERWAPPFNQPPFVWTRYRTPTAPGSWTSVAISWNGEIVAQMGAQPTVPNPPFTRCDLLTYFVRDFTIPAGIHNWIATVKTGPISRLARGGHADVFAFLRVFGPGFNSVDLQPVASNQTLSLLVGSAQFGGVTLQPGQYQIRVGSYNYIDYQGSARPYTEFIGSVTALTHYGPASTRSLAGSPAAESFFERLASDEGLLRQTAPAGVDPFELIAFEEG